MTDERRHRVLHALVTEYIERGSPVGSRTLVDRYQLGCSPATVRSELSILEETGLVSQPHVSAGRVPTDSGYRSYLDRLDLIDDAALGRAAVAEISRQATELEDLMRATSSLLSRMTDCLALVYEPSVATAELSRVSLVRLAAERLLVVVVTGDAHVVSRSLEGFQGASGSEIAALESALNDALAGKTLVEIVSVHEALALASETASALLLVVREVTAALQEAARDRVHSRGFASLLGSEALADRERAQRLATAVERGLETLVSETEPTDALGTSVRIGRENASKDLQETTVVSSEYGSAASDGLVAVVGPTRMDYHRVIRAVRAVSDALDKVLHG